MLDRIITLNSSAPSGQDQVIPNANRRLSTTQLSICRENTPSSISSATLPLDTFRHVYMVKQRNLTTMADLATRLSKNLFWSSPNFQTDSEDPARCSCSLD